MVDSYMTRCVTLVMVGAGLASVGLAQVPELDPHEIFGVVMEERGGTADVPVFVCDGKTGLPLQKGSYEPFDWSKPDGKKLQAEMAMMLSDERGKFRFENVPDGTYRLVAQRWMGEYKGLFEVHGTVIQLLGTAGEVVVPRPAEYYEAQVGLRPAGDGIVQFDMEQGNSETLLLLSTRPLEYDVALGFSALGEEFMTHLVGVNRMPIGKTTVIGVPNEKLHAFFFAADNLPGVSAITVEPTEGGLVRVPSEPFVAPWSNGRKTPPEDLAELGKLLDENGATIDELLEIPPLSSKTPDAFRQRMKVLGQDLGREVEVAQGRTVRVGDLLALRVYRQLQE